jgi:ABC-2 type transport system permease protein
VTSQGLEKARGGSVRASGTSNLLRAAWVVIRKTLNIAELEARKLRHDFLEIIIRAGGPAMWLIVFGQALNNTRAIPTGEIPYLDYIAPGIMAQGMLFTAVFYGIAVIWERDLGVLHKFLAAPVPRVALVAGKALSSGVRTVPQTLVIMALALLLGVRLNPNPLALGLMILGVMLGASLFATLSLIIACIVRRGERFVGINQVIILPLFFASNAIYPISIMPGWLQALSQVNPLTYAVDMYRALMIEGGASLYGVGVDLVILGAVTVILTWIAARLYPTLVT